MGTVLLVTRSLKVSGSVTTPVSVPGVIAPPPLGPKPNITGGATVSIVNCSDVLRAPKAVLIGLVELYGSMICTRAEMLWIPSASVSLASAKVPLPVGPPWLPIVSMYK